MSTSTGDLSNHRGSAERGGRVLLMPADEAAHQRALSSLAHHAICLAAQHAHTRHRALRWALGFVQTGLVLSGLAALVAPRGRPLAVVAMLGSMLLGALWPLAREVREESRSESVLSSLARLPAAAEPQQANQSFGPQAAP